MRRRMRLPATCIGWGPIGDVGYLTRSTVVRDNLSKRLGKPPINAVEALEQLDQILSSGNRDILTTAANFDWEVLAKVLPSASSNRFAILNRNTSKEGINGEAKDILSLIVNKTPIEITGIVRNLVTQNVAQVMLIKADQIETMASLHDMGLDSLMAVELAQGLEQSFGIQLPIMMLNEAPTVERVTSFIVEKLIGNAQADAICPTEALVQDLARQHGEEISQFDIDYLVDDIKGPDMGDRSSIT